MEQCSSKSNSHYSHEYFFIINLKRILHECSGFIESIKRVEESNKILDIQLKSNVHTAKTQRPNNQNTKST